MFTRKLVNRLTMPTKHIVVCEDDLYNQAQIAHRLYLLFGPQSHVQVSFVSGAEMCAAIMRSAIKVDVILLDHDMPYGDGVELLTWMKENDFFGKVKVITFSGISFNNERLMSAGADYSCNKNGVINALTDSLLLELTNE